MGPGNFVYRFYEFAPRTGERLPFPCQVLTISGEEAYLVILAEQGAVGLALFLGYLALSWVDLRRRFPDDERSDQLQAALAAGFVVACVGALFLVEQYYPPLWYLPAIGASLTSRSTRTETEGDGDAASGHPAPEALVPGGRRWPRLSGCVPAGPCLPDPPSLSSVGTGSMSKVDGLLSRPQGRKSTGVPWQRMRILIDRFTSQGLCCTRAGTSPRRHLLLPDIEAMCSPGG